MEPREARHAKITRPQLPAVYSRRRLFRLLQEHLKQASLWVEGPAGAGKSTLINSYLDTNRVPCLWYHFDERDAEIGNFFHYLAEAARVVTRGQGPPLPPLTPEYQHDIPAFTRNFFERFYGGLHDACAAQASDGAGGVCAIVFDDCHLVAPDSPLYDVLRLALSELIGGLRLILLSRRSLPPALIPARAGRRLAVIGWDDLRLSAEESRGIARCLSKGRLTRTQCERLHERAQGWVAGLILLLEPWREQWQERGGGRNVQVSEGAQEWHGTSTTLIEDYFTHSLFNDLAEERQAFLCKSALLPFMDAHMVARLTGCRDAGRILEELHRDHLFVELRHGDTRIYRYHALFREFLLMQGERYLPATALQRLRRQAGALLEEAGYTEEAAELFQLARDWGSLKRLILAEAQELFQQGRDRQLASWLESLPERQRQADPWLQYWMGYCRLSREPHRARESFEAAYEQFERHADHEGQLLTWAAVVESGFAVWNFHFLDHWLQRLPPSLDEEAVSSEPGLAARFTSAMFAALTFREPWRERIAIWAERLEQWIRSSPDPALKLQMGLFLIPYCSWTGELKRMNTLLGIVRPFALQELGPMAQLQYGVCEAYCAWFMSDGDRALEAVERGLATGEASGVHILDALLCSQGVYAALSEGDLTRGQGYLDRMRAACRESHWTNAAHYYHLAGWLAAMHGDREQAIRQLRTSLALAEQDGTVFPVACNHVELAGLLLESGAWQEAAEHLAVAQDTGDRMHSLTMEIKCALVQARLAFRHDREEDACRALRRALGTARAQGFMNLPWWYPPAMAEVCVKAMEYDIEPDYVRELVCKRHLVP